GEGNARAKDMLKTAGSEQMLSSPVHNPEEALAMLSGLWLWHDWLDESHVIAQSLNSATGSFWHAIVHRREGDFSNSQYWYARCEGHGVFAAMYQSATSLINPLPADKRLLRLVNRAWDADAFV